MSENIVVNRVTLAALSKILMREPFYEDDNVISCGVFVRLILRAWIFGMRSANASLTALCRCNRRRLSNFDEVTCTSNEAPHLE